MMLRTKVKALLRRCGLEVSRFEISPTHSLLGLRRLPIATIIDVGANTGQFARRARSWFPQARIVCFEPLPCAYAKLDAWARSEPPEIMLTMQTALGDSVGSVKIFEHAQHDASSSVLQTTATAVDLYPFIAEQQQVTVAMTTLDEALTTLPPVTPETLVKLDVQGFEDRVIRGGRSTLSSALACIIEVNLESLYEGQARFVDIVDLLSDLGHDYAGNLEQSYADDGRVVFFDAVFRRRLHR